MGYGPLVVASVLVEFAYVTFPLMGAVSSSHVTTVGIKMHACMSTIHILKRHHCYPVHECVQGYVE